MCRKGSVRSLMNSSRIKWLLWSNLPFESLCYGSSKVFKNIKDSKKKYFLKSNRALMTVDQSATQFMSWLDWGLNVWQTKSDRYFFYWPRSSEPRFARRFALWAGLFLFWFALSISESLSESPVWTTRPREKITVTLNLSYIQPSVKSAHKLSRWLVHRH